MATIPKMTPRSKHIGVKYFWLRSQVGPGTGISIVKCDTKDMLADIFTKGLPLDQFSVLRESLMGWTLAREGVSPDNLGENSSTISASFMAYSCSYFKKHACKAPDK